MLADIVLSTVSALRQVRREHVAGKRLREIMEKHHMRADVGGEMGLVRRTVSSLIDYVWDPAALPLSMLWSTPKNGCGTAVDWHATIARPRPTGPGI